MIHDPTLFPGHTSSSCVPKDRVSVALANRSGLLEAEISLPAVHRLADHHVIKHLDLENPGSFVEPASQTKISFARTRVAGHAASAIDGGTAPAGPAPQDARYPQSRRLRFRIRHQPMAVRARRYLGLRTRRTNELLYGSAGSGRDRKYCIAILAPRFWGRV